LIKGPAGASVGGWTLQKPLPQKADIHALAAAMPHTTTWPTPSGRLVYQVGGKSFVCSSGR